MIDLDYYEEEYGALPRYQRLRSTRAPKYEDAELRKIQQKKQYKQARNLKYGAHYAVFEND